MNQMSSPVQKVAIGFSSNTQIPRQWKLHSQHSRVGSKKATHLHTHSQTHAHDDESNTNPISSSAFSVSEQMPHRC